MREHDPMTAGIRAQLRSVQRELYTRTAHPPSRRDRVRFWLRIHLQNRWLDAILFVTPLAFLAGALILFLWSWPWNSSKVDEQQVVLGCAGVVALGSIIASAVALPIARSAELGPGFTVGLVRRARLWLIGLTVAPLSAFLFWLATMEPDSEAAVAAGLLAAGAFAGYWELARYALAEADSLAMTQAEASRLTRQVLRFMKLGEQLAVSTADESLDEGARMQAICDARVRLGSGPLRQLRSAATRLFRQGMTDEGYILYSSMVDSLLKMADVNKGAIGDYNGLPAIVVEAAPEFVAMATDHRDDNASVLLVQCLSTLAAAPGDHDDLAELRLHARAQLALILDQSWSDMVSRVPPTAAGEYSGLIARYVSMGATESAIFTLDPVVTLIERAQREAKPHVGQPAMDGFLRAFRSMAAVVDDEHRRSYLQRWSESARRLTALRVEPNGAWIRPIDQLLPGRSLWGGLDLQDELVRLGENVPALVDATYPSLSWLRDCLPSLARADQGHALSPLSSGLDVALCCALLLVHQREAIDPDTRHELGERVSNVATQWLVQLGQTGATRLLDADVAEVTWSLILAAGCIADDSDVTTTAATAIAPLLIVDSYVAGDGYLRAFTTGVFLLAGHTPTDIDETLARVEDRSWSSYLDFGMHIPPLGRAPSCNRNHAAHYTTAPDSVNQWALTNFPLLGAEPWEEPDAPGQ